MSHSIQLQVLVDHEHCKTSLILSEINLGPKVSFLQRVIRESFFGIGGFAVQWYLLMRTPSGPAILSSVERLIFCIQEYFWLVLCWEV